MAIQARAFLVASAILLCGGSAQALEPDETQTILQSSPLVRTGDAKTIDYSGGRGVATKTGALSYVFPIELPPGRMGVRPSLTLSYSSQSGRSLVGVGWELDGLP